MLCGDVFTRTPMEIIYGWLHVLVCQSGCGSRLERWLVRHKRSSSVEQLQAEMCSNLHLELVTLAAAMFTHNNLAFRDLFLEMGQCFVVVHSCKLLVVQALKNHSVPLSSEIFCNNHCFIWQKYMNSDFEGLRLPV